MHFSDEDVGNALIESGKVGCIVLAGGEGSRLGWKGPKGTFPLPFLNGKTLFEIFSEKIRGKVALMTSPLNEDETKKAFANSPNISFFSQDLLPLLDENKNLLNELRPNGNGEVFKSFVSSGLFHEWKKAGIEYVQVIPIDNPLAPPFDPLGCGRHHASGAEILLKAIPREDLSEKVGVIGEVNGKICVVEYLENPPSHWKLANPNLYSFRMDFIERIYDKPLPIHLVKKSLNGKAVFKQEYFIFDLLPFSKKTEVLLYPRDKIFAPLKSLEDLPHIELSLKKASAIL